VSRWTGAGAPEISKISGAVMKHRYSSLLVVLLATFTLTVSASDELKTPKEQISYVFGVQVARNLMQQGLDLDDKAFSKAVSDVWGKKKLRMSPEAMQASMQQFRAAMAKRFEEVAAKNEKEGNAYREKNKKTKGVVELSSGVQYRVLKKGKGKKPSTTDTVVVNYKGSLVNGKVFDSSYERKEPLTIAVNGVIPGWQEILPKMTVGSKWNVVIPPDMAYGKRGNGAIGPDSTLVFDIELLSIK
jgi:FKBP-type peptidyl-prolyl cis-trans isomerase FklB